MADIGNGTGLWPQLMRVRFSPCTPMIKIYLTECPKCHEVFQVSETYFYSFNPCVNFQCAYCSQKYMLIFNALDCLVCPGTWCKNGMRDVVLETPGCACERVY